MLDSGTSLIINGKETREEYFLLTSLPMADHRLINISSLKQAGGKAADMIFDNERIIDDLFVRTRPMQSGGWQALFRVHTRGDEPLSVEPEFGLFEVQGIDFDGSVCD